MGIETNYDSRKSLIKGDIRQFEMECGNTNVLVGGFGAILALTRTGALDEEAQKWMENFVNCEYGITDEGLFTGMSGIASVLYENGYTKEACKIFDKLKLNFISDF